MSKVLITGGGGFLGSHLCGAFQEHGVPVRVFDVAARPEWAEAEGIEYIQGDILDARALGEACEGARAAIHAAFASPRMAAAQIERVNVEGVREVCRQAASKGVGRLVLISSTIVERPARRHPFLRGAAMNALDMYRDSRKRAEEAAMTGRGLRVGIVRPKTFVGPGRVSAFTIVFDWIRLGKPVVLLGKADQPYQLLEIGDMAEGIRLLAESAAEGVFSFGAQRYGALREDLQALIDHAGTGSRLRFVPATAAKAVLRGMELAGLTPPSELHYMSAWGRASVVDTSRAVEELGWRPRWSNREALCRAYDWYVDSMRQTGSARSIHALPGSHRTLRRLMERFLR